MDAKKLVALLLIAASASALDLSYASYEALLKEHVCDGGVVYSQLVQDASLAQLDKEFSSVTAAEYSALAEKDKIAFLINAYNFYTLLLIKENYPLKVGIRDIKKPWDTKFIALLGKKVSLNDIEHKMLRRAADRGRSWMSGVIRGLQVGSLRRVRCEPGACCRTVGGELLGERPVGECKATSGVANLSRASLRGEDRNTG